MIGGFITKNRYIFPAIFTYADDGISIEFPDLPGCLPCADSTVGALKNAKEALELHLYGMEKDGDNIPEPTDIRHINLERNQTIVLIEVRMSLVRDEMQKVNIKNVKDVTLLGDITNEELLIESEKYDPENYNPLENINEKYMLLLENKKDKNIFGNVF